MKQFIICYYGTSGDGYVDYNGGSCHSLDNAMKFCSEDEANEKCSELQKEWQSKLQVEEVN